MGFQPHESLGTEAGTEHHPVTNCSHSLPAEKAAPFTPPKGHCRTYYYQWLRLKHRVFITASKDMAVIEKNSWNQAPAQSISEIIFFHETCDPSLRLIYTRDFSESLYCRLSCLELCLEMGIERVFYSR